MNQSTLISRNSTARRAAGASHRGFTLVELLVVIGIIAVLAALLFPVFKGVRQRAQATTCANNLNQLGLAFRQYLQDNGNRYPGAGQYQKWGNGGHWVAADTNGANATGKNGVDWSAMTDISDPNGQPYTGAEAKPEKGGLFPYVKNKALYVCPSEPNGEFKGLTYSMNCAIAGLNSTARMRQPTEIILLVDENNANDGFFWAFNAVGAGYPSASTDALSSNHSSGGNLLFCDGHVKFYNRAALPIGDEAKFPESATIETRTTGSPRFYDTAFDTNPAPPVEGFYTGPANTFGSCKLPDS